MRAPEGLGIIKFGSISALINGKRIWLSGNSGERQEARIETLLSLSHS